MQRAETVLRVYLGLSRRYARVWGRNGGRESIASREQRGILYSACNMSLRGMARETGLLWRRLREAPRRCLAAKGCARNLSYCSPWLESPPKKDPLSPFQI